MIVINYDALQSIIKNKKAKVLYLYEGHASKDYSDSSIRPFEKLTAATDHTDLATQLEKFAETFPDKFSVYIHSADNGVLTKGYFMHVDLGVRQAVPMVVQPNSENMSMEDMKVQILADLRRDQKIKSVREENKDLKLQLAQKDFMSDKLAEVGIKMLHQFGLFDMQPAMNGLQPNPAETMDGEEKKDEEAAPKITAEQALTYFREKLGDEALIKLVYKLEAKPSLIDTLKAFAG